MSSDFGVNITNGLQKCTNSAQPELQTDYHTIVLPGLAAVMDDINNPRTQSHAAAALVNFCDTCEAEILEKYLEPLLGKLYSLIQSQKIIVQQQV